MLPNHAKKVFEGVLFDIYQWEQKMFDGSTQTFERASKKNSTVTFALLNGEVVVSRQRQPGKDWYYAMPSGRIEDNETPLENARKELFEEAGVECDKLKEIAVYSFPHKIDYKCHFYLAINCRKVGPPTPDNGEEIEMFTVPIGKFVEMIHNDELQESNLIKQILKNGLTENSKNKLRDLFVKEKL